MTTIATEEKTRHDRAIEAYTTWTGLVRAAAKDPAQAKARDEYGRRYAAEVKEGEQLAVDAERQRVARVYQLRQQIWSLNRDLDTLVKEHNANMVQAKQLVQEADKVDMGPNSLGGHDARAMRDRAATLLGGAQSRLGAHVNMSKVRDDLAMQLFQIGGTL